MKFEFVNLDPVQLSGVHGTPISKKFEPDLVSIILPTYNRADFILDALRSVRAQTYRPAEILIVDDGSTDDTAAVVRQEVEAWSEDPAFRVVYLRQPNRGASAARNQGLFHSQGEFIQYLDSDDVLVKHKLAHHVRVLQADESMDIVWSDWWVVSSDQLAEKLAEADRLDQSPVETAWQPNRNIIPWEPWPTLTRRRFVAQHPLWNEETSRWDDWEYALRLMVANPRRAFVPGIVCIQREHQKGRRQDFDVDSKGVEKGFAAARAAAAARDFCPEKRPELDQCVADRYWELFLEAIKHGLSFQATEAICGAVRFGRAPSFRAKVSFLKLFLRVAGMKAAHACLRYRYLKHTAG